MIRRKAVPQALPARDLSHMVADTTRAGEIVGIRGQYGSYKIVREVLNCNNGSEWVEMWGGIKGHSQFTCATPDRILKRRQPRVQA